MVRTIIVMIWTGAATILFGIPVIVISFFDPTGKYSHWVARAWAKSILFVGGIKVDIKGLAHLDPSMTCIYMCNHQSFFDIPVLLAHLKVQFRWLAKAELFRIPFFGFAMKRSGYISVDRKNREVAISSLKVAAASIRKGGSSVIIFPEGTRSMDGNISAFKKGGFRLALDAGVPIVPVILYGTRAILPKKQLRVIPGTAVMEISEPVDTSGYSKENKEELMDRIQTIICDGFDRIRVERT